MSPSSVAPLPRLVASDFFSLLRPSECGLRVWLRAQDEPEAPPSPYARVLMDLGLGHERRHLARFPSHLDLGHLPIGERAGRTRELVELGERVVYQGALRVETRLAGTDLEVVGGAPSSWRSWVKDGSSSIERVRRRLLRRPITSVADQLPAPGSAEHALLGAIYDHYHGKKGYFEALAAAVAERVLTPAGAAYKTHGLTRGGGDFGIDFVAQLDVGEGFSHTALGVLGQAKCVSSGGQANAQHLARTVARLRRGWLGVFVTTGAISVKAQREVFEDRYPLVMIPGLRVAHTVRQMLLEGGHEDVEALLSHFDGQFEVSPRIVDPERALS